MNAGLLYFCSQHFFVCSGSNGFSIFINSLCTLLPVQIESCNQCYSLLLGLSELAHNLPYRLSNPFSRRAICFVTPTAFAWPFHKLIQNTVFKD